MRHAKRIIFIAITVVIAISFILSGLVWWDFGTSRTASPPTRTPMPQHANPSPTPAPSPTLPPTPPAPPPPVVTPPPAPLPAKDAPLSEALVKKLEIPWALDFLPDGSIIFTERPGRIRLIDAQGRLQTEPLLTIDEVAPRGEGGLLGIALHPDFTRNPFVYVYYTYQGRDSLLNRVVGFRMEGKTLGAKKVVLDNIPAGSIHDGGRIKFGPDGLLYITTGDSGNANLAQDRNSLAGKILRIRDDGGIPPDNPFPASPVYSFGHRNPEGLAWDSQGRLWATEHGSSATDELNLVEPGKNYGWPTIRGDAQAPGMVSPITHSGSDTWAPSGMAYFNGSLYFTGLRGQSLFQAVINDRTVTLKRYLNGNFGRLRDVVVGPDKFLYVLTSNRDGRGTPAADDDQLLRINPAKLQ